MRLFQLAKWDIVRAKEKEALAKLSKLKLKQKYMIKGINHLTLFKIVMKLSKQFESLKI